MGAAASAWGFGLFGTTSIVASGGGNYAKFWEYKSAMGARVLWGLGVRGRLTALPHPSAKNAHEWGTLDSRDALEGLVAHSSWLYHDGWGM